jgi:uncharacterized membrane protein (UPF0182 family)
MLLNSLQFLFPVVSHILRPCLPLLSSIYIQVALPEAVVQFIVEPDALQPETFGPHLSIWEALVDFRLGALVESRREKDCRS